MKLLRTEAVVTTHNQNENSRVEELVLQLNRVNNPVFCHLVINHYVTQACMTKTLRYT